MKKAILFAAVLFVIAPPVALSAPKAASAEECAVLADLALVASAAARHGMQRPTVEAMLADIYTINDEGRAGALAAAILDVVFGGAREVMPRVLAGNLGDACMRNEGDMDSILGTGA